MDQSQSESRQPLVKLLLVCAVVAVLYLGRQVLVPLTLAILLAFLLSPLVSLFERLRLPRLLAAALSVGCALAIVASVAYLMAAEFVTLANDLPSYKDNIRSKIQQLTATTPGPFSRASETLKELRWDLLGRQNPQGGAQLVEIAEPPTNPLNLAYGFLGPLITPLATLGIIILLSGILLLKREEVRDRFIRLVSAGELSVTTQAIEEAAERVTRFLLTNLTINATYGLSIGLGLYFIGVPNAPLWGMLCALLRFIPYAGPWIGAAMPVFVSIAVSSGWQQPLMACLLFLIIELISNNVLEPWLYGASTGLSSLAVLLAAVFWTWLWGTVGLVLSTPITVCFAVLGRYVPQFEFLAILLTDEPVLPRDARLYQRLLAEDLEECSRLCEEELETLEPLTADALAAYYDRLLLPVLALEEHDRHRGRLESAKSNFIVGAIQDWIEEARARADTLTPAVEQFSRKLQSGTERSGAQEAPSRIAFLPANDAADSAACSALAAVLDRRATEARILPADRPTSETAAELENWNPQIVCLTAVGPYSPIRIRQITRALKPHVPQARIVECIWTRTDELPDIAQRLRTSGYDDLVTTAASTKSLLALSGPPSDHQPRSANA